MSWCSLGLGLQEASSSPVRAPAASCLLWVTLDSNCIRAWLMAQPGSPGASSVIPESLEVLKGLSLSSLASPGKQDFSDMSGLECMHMKSHEQAVGVFSGLLGLPANVRPCLCRPDSVCVCRNGGLHGYVTAF